MRDINIPNSMIYTGVNMKPHHRISVFPISSFKKNSHMPSEFSD